METSKRESFVFRRSFYEPIRDLNDEDRGILVGAICNYAFDDAVPTLSPVLKMAFNFIIATIDRDIAKYQSVIERNQKNGRGGGRPKNPTGSEEKDEPKKPTGFLTNPPESEEPKKAYTICECDSNTISDSDSNSECDSENSLATIFLKSNSIAEKSAFEFMGSQMWFETKAMQLCSTRNQINESAKEFVLDLRDRDMLEGKTLIDLRSHFVSWFKKHQPKALNGSSFIPKASDR